LERPTLLPGLIAGFKLQKASEYYYEFILVIWVAVKAILIEFAGIPIERTFWFNCHSSFRPLNVSGEKEYR
jgi:hypothetical protein